jgi:hypothetical protein
MADVDPFLVFRTALFIGLGVYTVLTLSATVLQLVRLFRGTDPSKRLLRAYVSYQLVTFRVRPLAGELTQIALWSLVLLFIWWLH